MWGLKREHWSSVEESVLISPVFLVFSVFSVFSVRGAACDWAGDPLAGGVLAGASRHQAKVNINSLECWCSEPSSEAATTTNITSTSPGMSGGKQNSLRGIIYLGQRRRWRWRSEEQQLAAPGPGQLSRLLPPSLFVERSYQLMWALAQAGSLCVLTPWQCSPWCNQPTLHLTLTQWKPLTRLGGPDDTNILPPLYCEGKWLERLKSPGNLFNSMNHWSWSRLDHNRTLIELIWQASLSR